MKYILFLLPVIMSACNPSSGKTNNTLTNKTIADSSYECSYAYKKQRCRQLLALQQNEQTNTNVDAFIADSLISCWYGTPWNFNGTTDTPGKGTIACGYFVTTVLKDAGVAVNRIKMAQCPSSELIRAVCVNISSYSNYTLEDFVEKVRKKGTGLFIVGLDLHTGFLYNNGNEVYFIHASYYPPRCVVKESALQSVALRNTRLRMIGKIRFG